eukprot:ANDGO_07345.mRNA.1 Bromodomain and WD repeat-containing DDB_G0285837
MNDDDETFRKELMFLCLKYLQSCPEFSVVDLQALVSRSCGQVRFPSSAFTMPGAPARLDWSDVCYLFSDIPCNTLARMILPLVEPRKGENSLLLRSDSVSGASSGKQNQVSPNVLTALRSRSRSSKSIPDVSSFLLKFMMQTKGHLLGVTCACFDTTGFLIGTGGADGNFKIWRSDTGQLVRTFRGHLGSIDDCAINCSNEYLATASTAFAGCQDYSVRLWNLRTGENVFVENGFLCGFVLIRFFFPNSEEVAEEDSSNGKSDNHFESLERNVANERLVVVSSDGTVRVLDFHGTRVRSKSVLVTNRQAANQVTWANLSPQRDIVLCGLRTGEVVFVHVGSIADTCLTKDANCEAALQQSLRTTAGSDDDEESFEEGADESSDASVDSDIGGDSSAPSDEASSRIFLTKGARESVFEHPKAAVSEIHFASHGFAALILSQHGLPLVCTFQASSSTDVHTFELFRIDVKEPRRLADDGRKVSSIVNAAVWTLQDRFCVLACKHVTTSNASSCTIQVIDGQQLEPVHVFDVETDLRSFFGSSVAADQLSQPIEFISVNPKFEHLLLAYSAVGVVSLWDLKSFRLISAIIISQFSKASNLLQGGGRAARGWGLYLDEWSPDGLSFIMADNDGFIYLFAAAEEPEKKVYATVPVEQFFKNDTHVVSLDMQGYALDAVTQRRFHEFSESWICNLDGEVYNPQPFSSNGFVPNVPLLDIIEFERRRRHRLENELQRQLLMRDLEDRAALGHDDDDDEVDEYASSPSNSEDGADVIHQDAVTDDGDADAGSFDEQRIVSFDDVDADEMFQDILRKNRTWCMRYFPLERVAVEHGLHYVPFIGEEVIYFTSGHRAHDQRYPCQLPELLPWNMFGDSWPSVIRGRVVAYNLREEAPYLCPFLNVSIRCHFEHEEQPIHIQVPFLLSDDVFRCDASLSADGVLSRNTPFVISASLYDHSRAVDTNLEGNDFLITVAALGGKKPTTVEYLLPVRIISRRPIEKVGPLNVWRTAESTDPWKCYIVVATEDCLHGPAAGSRFAVSPFELYSSFPDFSRYDLLSVEARIVKEAYATDPGLFGKICNNDPSSLLFILLRCSKRFYPSAATLIGDLNHLKSLCRVFLPASVSGVESVLEKVCAVQRSEDLDDDEEFRSCRRRGKQSRKTIVTYEDAMSMFSRLVADHTPKKKKRRAGRRRNLVSDSEEESSSDEPVAEDAARTPVVSAVSAVAAVSSRPSMKRGVAIEEEERRDTKKRRVADDATAAPPPFSPTDAFLSLFETYFTTQFKRLERIANRQGGQMKETLTQFRVWFSYLRKKADFLCSKYVEFSPSVWPTFQSSVLSLFSEEFVEPVPLDDYPDYMDYIVEAISVSDIGRKVYAGNWLVFLLDVWKMVTNSLVYNSAFQPFVSKGLLDVMTVNDQLQKELNAIAGASSSSLLSSALPNFVSCVDDPVPRQVSTYFSRISSSWIFEYAPTRSTRKVRSISDLCSEPFDSFESAKKELGSCIDLVRTNFLSFLHACDPREKKEKTKEFEDEVYWIMLQFGLFEHVSAQTDDDEEEEGEGEETNNNE